MIDDDKLMSGNIGNDVQVPFLWAVYIAAVILLLLLLLCSQIAGRRRDHPSVRLNLVVAVWWLCPPTIPLI
jgi:hypothetical protein